MKKNRKNPTPLIVDVARERRHAEVVAALRDGRKQRAVRFADRRKEADRRACRGRVAY
jgi:hypothetical protein